MDADRVGQLVEMFAAEWWTNDRSADDVAAMIAASDLVVTLIHRESDRLVGFARVLTDYAYLAVVLDVIVAPDMRGVGLGGVLLGAVVGHCRLAAVRSIELVCQPEMVPFYRQWGFSTDVGRSRLMRRTSDPRLGGAEGDGW
ncbi:GNAT family N-acetyltransferase [Micromonospora sp. NPDC000089]|uniref:GNAT family N-acetyltransferase n=1 Tax=unclassified Micromonospora TaxID=2617518 RepID=UPI0036A0D202